MEEQLETEHVSPETTETEDQKASSSTGIGLLFGVGLAVAFAVGLLAGFIMRPMVVKDVPVQVVVTVVPPPVQEVAQLPTPTNSPTEVVSSATEEPTDEVSPTTEPTVDPNATATPTIMEFVLSDARHFQGSEGAPVTVVEFSDFK